MDNSEFVFGESTQIDKDDSDIIVETDYSVEADKAQHRGSNIDKKVGYGCVGCGCFGCLTFLLIPVVIILIAFFVFKNSTNNSEDSEYIVDNTLITIISVQNYFEEKYSSNTTSVFDEYENNI